MNFPILSLVTFLPLVGALAILAIRGADEGQVASNARFVALWTSLITFVISLFILVGFDPTVTGFQLVEEVAWIPALGITYIKGVDGIALWFILASTLLTPICILCSWTAIQSRVKEYMIALLVLETMMVGMFSALDLFLFYLFFEGVLLPMFLMIGVWGGQRRIYASYKFFLYTFAGSVFMFVALLALYLSMGTADMRVILESEVARDLQFWCWIGFFAAFMVKSPMWPTHTWLPDAHVEAPTAGSVMLAGILLKMGGYGLLRFNIQMFPLGSEFFAPLVFALSVIAIIYASLVAFVQEDMKKLVAYSSVAHMGYVTLGAFTGTLQGIEGAMMVMLSHTIVSSALFLLVGVVYDRMHTREIRRYGGMANNMPVYATVFMIFTLASVGLPGTSGFVGEFLSLAGTFQVNTWAAALATTGVILGALYMLNLYRRLFFGKLEKEEVKAMPDLSLRELSYFIPLVALVIWMGIHPTSFSRYFTGELEQIVERYQAAIAVEGASFRTPDPEAAGLDVAEDAE